MDRRIAVRGARVRRCEVRVRRCEVQVRRFVVRRCCCGVAAGPTLATAQVMERITFDDAIRRAIANNPTVQQAAAGILRAEALLGQATSRTRPSIDAGVAVDVIDPVTSFDGNNITPRWQSASSASFRAPLWTPLAWAQRVQAGDQVFVAQTAAADVRQQLAAATADAYLAVIVQRRGLELNEQARDNARAHYDFANQRFEGGLGSRLNMLRALQELSTDEARIEGFTALDASRAGSPWRPCGRRWSRGHRRGTRIQRASRRVAARSFEPISASSWHGSSLPSGCWPIRGRTGYRH